MRLAPVLLALALAGCATPRLYSESELSLTASRCSLSAGDLIQEQDLKKVLMWIANRPTVTQHRCVKQWASRRHLNLAVVTIDRIPR